jgi:hypothetical protein
MEILYEYALYSQNKNLWLSAPSHFDNPRICWPLLAITLLVPVFPAHGQILVRGLRVDGNRRLKESAIAAASGLRVGAEITRDDLDSAAHRLADTGLFTAVNYRYAPGGVDASNGYSVTLIVNAYYVRELEFFLSREGHPEHLTIQDETDLSTHQSVRDFQVIREGHRHPTPKA